MEMKPLTELFDWLLRSSWQACVLIGLILAIQCLFRDRIAPRWRYMLWLVVFVRLALPISPQSAISFFNLAKLEARRVPAQKQGLPENIGHLQSIPNSRSSQPTPVAVQDVLHRLTPSAFESELHFEIAGSNTVIRPPRAIYIISLAVWGLGFLFLLARWLWQNARALDQLRTSQEITESCLLELFQYCRASAKVSRRIKLLNVDGIGAPALYGAFRLKLLLPSSLWGKLASSELQHIMLHELAHVKRWDSLVNAVLAIVRMVHWFNPLVWLAFRRLALEREMACDEMAMGWLKKGESKAYGETILKLLESVPLRRPTFTTVGILEDYRQLTNRMRAIAGFGRSAARPYLAATTLALLVAVGLTDAQIGSGKTTSDKSRFSITRSLNLTRPDETGAQLAPDESKIAFVEGSDWTGNLVVQDLKTHQRWQITHSDTNQSGVYSYRFSRNTAAIVWSPDSKRIAFFWAGNTNDTGIRIASADGGDNRLVRSAEALPQFMIQGNPAGLPFFEDRKHYYPADWSRDGRFLLCSVMRSHKGGWPLQDLVQITVDSGEMKTIVSDIQVRGWTHAFPIHARYSPDGHYAVFHQSLDENRGISCVRINDGTVERLTDSLLIGSKPVWSADGKYVIFTRGKEETPSWDLWAVPVQQGKRSGDSFPLRSSLSHDYSKRMSSQGNLICSGQRTDRVDSLVSVDPRSGDLSPARPVLADFGPYGVRGNHYYYSQKGTLFVAAIDGRQQSYEIPLAKVTGYHQITADGRRMVVAGRNAQDRSGFFLFDLDSRKFEPLILSQEHRIHYGAGLPGNEKEVLLESTNGYVALDIETKRLRKLHSPRKPFFGGGSTQPENGHHPFPALLQTMYVERNQQEQEDQLTLFDFNTGATQIVARAKAPARILRPFWRVTQPNEIPQITYISVNKDGRKELHLVAIDGSSDRIISTGDLNLDHLKRPNISFDGSMMAAGFGADYDVSEYVLLSLDGKWQRKMPLSGVTWDSGWWLADNRTLLVPSKRVQWEIAIIETEFPQTRTVSN